MTFPYFGGMESMLSTDLYAETIEEEEVEGDCSDLVIDLRMLKHPRPNNA